MNELKNRGAQDILIAVVDGLKGFPEAINAVFPQTVIQTCIVHLIRHSMDFAAWKDRKNVAQALRAVYRAADAKIGQAALDAFAQSPWGEKYPAIAQSSAPQLGPCHSVLRVPRRRPQNYLHNERHRGAELKAAPGHQNQGPFPI